MIKQCNNCKYWRLGTASLDDNYCNLTGEWSDYDGYCDSWEYLMTEKRFIMTGYAIWDSQNNNRRVSTETAYKLLNELNDENNELKQLVKKVIDERVVDYPLLCKLKKMVKE